MVFRKSRLLIVQMLCWSDLILSFQRPLISVVREMGLKFSVLVFDPFLYKGFNLAILPSIGKRPEEMELLHISAIGFTRICAPSFKNLPEILSIPAAFEMFMHCEISKLLFSVD